MPVANPYADLRALLDATRQLTPEEMAELQLEQGYVDRALSIYDELTARDPSNTSYATRRAWLARMAAVRPARTIVACELGAPVAPPRVTLHGIGPAALSGRAAEARAGVAPQREATGAGDSAVVRALRIVRVR